jgi:hypothetical protein
MYDGLPLCLVLLPAPAYGSPCLLLPGHEVSRQLAGQGYHVVLACRNMGACADMKQQLDALHLPGTTECCRWGLPQDNHGCRHSSRRYSTHMFVLLAGMLLVA